MSVDLNSEANLVREGGKNLRDEGWLSGVSAPSQVAAYVAASERVDDLSTHDIVDIVKQGLDVEVATDNSAAVKNLARDVLARLAQA